jgi:hypothetical protein
MEGKPEVPILDLMESAIEAGPAVRNNGGGHYNHAFFWTEMAPPDQAKKTKPSAQLQALIDKSFGSLDKMKEAFNARAAPGALFGSGWVWVCVNKKGDELKLVGTPNQDNPLMKGAADEVMFPILGLDVRGDGSPVASLASLRDSHGRAFVPTVKPLSHSDCQFDFLASTITSSNRYGSMLTISSIRTAVLNTLKTGGISSTGTCGDGSGKMPSLVTSVFLILNA